MYECCMQQMTHTQTEKIKTTIRIKLNQKIRIDSNQFFFRSSFLRKWKLCDLLTRNLFDRSILWIATIPLCDKSRLHNVNAAKLVSDMTGIFGNILYDKSNLNHYPKKKDVDDAENRWTENQCRTKVRKTNRISKNTFCIIANETKFLI